MHLLWRCNKDGLYCRAVEAKAPRMEVGAAVLREGR
jgi:hypothetical protein